MSQWRPRALIFCLVAGFFVQGCSPVLPESEKGLVEGYYEVQPALSKKWVKLVLDNKFIEKYRDRAAMEITLTVDDSNKWPKPAYADGDLHIAGRALEAGLPVVAEIVNSIHEGQAVRFIHSVQGKGIAVPVSGVWRIWFEHPGELDEVQGAGLKPLNTENPDHVFEIHPVTRIGRADKSGPIDIRASMRPVKGYLPGGARLAFKAYEGIKFRFERGQDKTTIFSRRAPFNDVEFVMEIKRQVIVPDGRFVIADALDLKGNKLAGNIRMVFMKDTPPEKAVSGLKTGDRLHVFAMPRINFSALMDEIKRPGPPERHLPYEMIIIGVF